MRTYQNTRDTRPQTPSSAARSRRTRPAPSPRRRSTTGAGRTCPAPCHSPPPGRPAPASPGPRSPTRSARTYSLPFPPRLRTQGSSAVPRRACSRGGGYRAGRGSRGRMCWWWRRARWRPRAPTRVSSPRGPRLSRGAGPTGSRRPSAGPGWSRRRRGRRR